MIYMCSHNFVRNCNFFIPLRKDVCSIFDVTFSVLENLDYLGCNLVTLTRPVVCENCISVRHIRAVKLLLARLHIV